MASSVSLLILTLNEEDNMPSCLEAISWCDDIVVMDSFSNDRTVELVEQSGARVFQRKFDSFAGQRNYALENVDFKHEWVFHLDADEVFTDALRREIEQVIGNADYDAYRVPSKMMFMGQWLRYSGMYPSYQERLSRCPDFRFKMVGHGQKADIDLTRIGTMQEPYLHYSFAKGMADWFERHNRYSTHEAEAALQHRQESRMDWPGLLSGDHSRRRMAMRALVFRIPCRPLLRFMYMYFFRLGFLDGMAGFTYCRMMGMYEFMITVKMQEQQRGLH